MNGSEITANRKTHLRLALDENVSSEPPRADTRKGGEICRSGFGSANSLNMDRLGTGGILLNAYQKVLTTQTEQTDTGLTLIPLSRFQTIPGYVERNHYAGPSFLSGVTLQAATLPSGFPMAEKTVPAGQSGGWAQTLQPIVDAVASFIPTNRLAQYDCHAYSMDTFEENEGFTWRFRTPSGHQYTAMQTGFHFGGAVNANKNGMYSLVASGKFLYLAEFSQANKDGGGNGWCQVDKWQYITANNPGQIVTIEILPYKTDKGNLFIEFTADTQAEVENSNNSQLNMQILTVGGQIAKHIFQINTSKNSPSYAPGMPTRVAATGAGPIRIDMARELRMPWQVSVTRYLPNGWWEDYPVSLSFGLSTRGLITLRYSADQPLGTTLTMRLMDATTRTELTAAGSFGTNYKQYLVNLNQPNMYVRAEYTSDSSQKKTPVVYDYSVQTDAWIATATPGEFEVTEFEGINVSGPDADPSHESASTLIMDKKAAYSILSSRAFHRTRIETEFDPAHTDVRSVLFDGYLQQARGKRRGSKGGPGASAAGTKAYPSQFWKDFECAFIGMWMRLHTTLVNFRLDLQSDKTAPQNPDGSYPPFKVTDICRALIGYAGFTSGQIDVPDNAIRFFPGGTENGSTLMIDPLSNVAEAVVKFLREYLGWYLIWDGNAGTAGGMWRAIAPVPTQGPYNNLARFTLDRQGAGKLALASGSYNGDTHGLEWCGSLTTIPTVPIFRDSFDSYPIRPEGNAVCVTGTGDYLPSNGQFKLTNWIMNAKSYDCFADAGGTTIHTADPSHPDYIGFLVPIVVVNFSFLDQASVDVLCRRIYDVSCHGTKIIQLESPLCLVVDPNDTKQQTPRPLRYGDPVFVREDGVDSQWLVRNCNPHYRKDAKQMQYVELQQPFTD